MHVLFKTRHLTFQFSLIHLTWFHFGFTLNFVDIHVMSIIWHPDYYFGTDLDHAAPVGRGRGWHSELFSPKYPRSLGLFYVLWKLIDVIYTDSMVKYCGYSRLVARRVFAKRWTPRTVWLTIHGCSFTLWNMQTNLHLINLIMWNKCTATVIVMLENNICMLCRTLSGYPMYPDQCPKTLFPHDTTNIEASYVWTVGWCYGCYSWTS